jgi:hypothetical protein
MPVPTNLRRLQAMANFAYLTTATTRITFPMLHEPGYDSKLHTIACGRWGIPLLWFPLFQRGDLLTEDVEVDGRIWRDPAPVVETSTALERLRASIPRLNSVFQAQGSLSRLAELLREAIASTERPFLTLEPHQIAYMEPAAPKRFYELFERTLAYFEQPETALSINELLTLTPCVSEPDLPFPDPDDFRGRDYDAEGFELLGMLLGRAYFRPVPWDRRQKTIKPTGGEPWA